MISVIIPLFNKQFYIKRAIDSVLNQTYQKFELIIIDDGSTDQSPLHVRDYNDPRIIYYRKENGGESSARNLGISYAKSEYICFLDADDEWLPIHLETVISMVKKYVGCEVISTNYYISLNNQNRLAHSLTNNDFIIDDYFKFSLKKLPILTSNTVVIKKEIIETIGLFDEKLRHGPDLDYWFRIALRYNIIFVPIPTAIYHQEADNRVMNNILDFNDVFIEKLIDNMQNYNSNLFAWEYIQEVFFREIRLHLKMNKNILIRQKLMKYRTSLKLGSMYWMYLILSLAPIKLLVKIKTKLN